MSPRNLILAAVLSVVVGGCTAGGVTFQRPNGVAVGVGGDLFVMDRGNHRMVHVAPDGTVAGTWGRLGTGDEHLYSGWDAALDDAGNVYVCNQVRDENGYLIHDGVKVFTAEGRFVRELGGEDYPAHPDARARKVYGLDVDRAQRIYTADYGTNTVRVFDRAGRPLGELFGRSGIGDGEFDGLNDVAVDDERGLLYAVDHVNGRVQQFSLAVTDDQSPSVAHRVTLGGYGQAMGQLAYPQYISVDDRTGRVYVGDMGNRRIQVFDTDGAVVGVFAPPDVPDWQVMGLAVTGDNTIYAADAFNNALWLFDVDGRLRRRIGGGR